MSGRVCSKPGSGNDGMESLLDIRRFLSLARQGFERLSYIPTCSICDQAVHPPLPSPFVCRPCLSTLPFRMEAESVQWQESFPLYASFFYRDPLPRLIVSLKFAGRTDRAEALGPLLEGTVRRRGLLADAIIPVPLHKRRQRERGYNQALLLAESLARSIAVPVLDGLLVRQLHTERQSEAQSAAERQVQLRDAFEINTSSRALESLRGRPVILLDDVLTSGATLAEAARPLLKAGIRVRGLVVATNKDRFKGYRQALDPWYVKGRGGRDLL